MSRVVVFGTGLAGTVAALAARRAGAEVVVITGPPGASALWLGALQIYGPTTPLRGDALPLIDQPLRPPAGVAVAQGASARLNRMLSERPYHPFAVLGLDDAAVGNHVEEALAAMGGPPVLVAEPSTQLVTDGGTLLDVDGAAATLFGNYATGRRRRWLALPEALERTPTRLAHATATRLSPADPVDPLRLEWQADGLDSPTGLLGFLDHGPDDPQVQPFLDAFRRALKDTDLDTLLVPPLFGRTFECAGAWMARLSEIADATVVERAPLEDPIAGLRLWTWLRGRLERAGIRSVAGRARDVLLRGDGSAVTVEFETPEGREVIEDVSGVVLATGRMTGGGITAEAPLGEATLGLPVYLDGQALGPGAQPSELLGLRPWSDHPIMRLGVAVDAGLRPWADSRTPRWSNVFAAGRLIGGTNAALDGSAEGVDLVTGHLAGLAAAGGGA